MITFLNLILILVDFLFLENILIGVIDFKLGSYLSESFKEYLLLLL